MFSARQLEAPSQEPVSKPELSPQDEAEVKQAEVEPAEGNPAGGSDEGYARSLFSQARRRGKNCTDFTHSAKATLYVIRFIVAEPDTTQGTSVVLREKSADPAEETREPGYRDSTSMKLLKTQEIQDELEDVDAEGLQLEERGKQLEETIKTQSPGDDSQLLSMSTRNRVCMRCEAEQEGYRLKSVRSYASSEKKKKQITRKIFWPFQKILKFS